MKKTKKYLILSLILLAIAICYTALVKMIDVQAIGPENSEVGFATINGAFHNKFGFSEMFYKVSKYAGYIPFLLVAFTGLMGLKELIEKKSLSKVDSTIYGLCGFYVLFAIVYVAFEKIAINFRPVILEEGLEASFPSTHTMLAICICGSSMMASKYLIKKENLRKIFNICLEILMAVIVIARTLSGVHWITDIIGGIIISSYLLVLLKTFFDYASNDKECKH